MRRSNIYYDNIFKINIASLRKQFIFVFVCGDCESASFGNSFRAIMVLVNSRSKSVPSLDQTARRTTSSLWDEEFDPFQVFEVDHEACLDLEIEIKSGENITKGSPLKDFLDTPDPYVVLSIPGSSNLSQRTTALDNTVTPMWNQTFHFFLEPKKSHVLHIILMDANYTLDENLGQDILHISSMPMDKTFDHTFTFPGGSMVYTSIKIQENKSPDLRFSLSLCNEEKEFLMKRREKVLSSLQKLLGDRGPMGKEEVPVVAVLGSGGGFRAMASFSGCVKALSQNDIMDCVTYISGLSGSSWMISTLYAHDEYPNISFDTIYEELKESVTHGWKKFLRLAHSYMFDMILKYRRGQPVSFTDFFGHLLGDVLLKGKKTITLSNQQQIVSEGVVPFPLYTCLHAKAAVSCRNFSEWVEFSPYEIGIAKYGTFMKTEHFGSKFLCGKRIKSFPEFPLHFLQGIWGSAFTILFKRLILEGGSHKALVQILRDIKDERDFVEKVEDHILENNASTPVEIDSDSDDERDVIGKDDKVFLSLDGHSKNVHFSTDLNNKKDFDEVDLSPLSSTKDINLGKISPSTMKQKKRNIFARTKASLDVKVNTENDPEMHPASENTIEESAFNYDLIRKSPDIKVNTENDPEMHPVIENTIEESAFNYDIIRKSPDIKVNTEMHPVNENSAEKIPLDFDFIRKTSTVEETKNNVGIQAEPENNRQLTTQQTSRLHISATTSDLSKLMNEELAKDLLSPLPKGHSSANVSPKLKNTNENIFMKGINSGCKSERKLSPQILPANGTLDKKRKFSFDFIKKLSREGREEVSYKKNGLQCSRGSKSTEVTPRKTGLQRQGAMKSPTPPIRSLSRQPSCHWSERRESLLNEREEKSTFIQSMMKNSNLLNSRVGRAGEILNPFRGLSVRETFPISPFSSVCSDDECLGALDIGLGCRYNPLDNTAKKLFVVDSGLAFNSPFPLLLRPQRGVNLYLSFDFSQRPKDSFPPFKELLLAEKWAIQNEVPFPPIEIQAKVFSKEKEVKEVYVFKHPTDRSCPVILHFPIVNNKFQFYKSPGVKRQTLEELEFANFNLFDDSSQPYSSTKFIYSELQYERLVKLSEFNTLLCLDTIKDELVAVIKNKKELNKVSLSDTARKIQRLMAVSQMFKSRLHKFSVKVNRKEGLKILNSIRRKSKYVKNLESIDCSSNDEFEDAIESLSTEENSEYIL